jgi:hypothetical protein
MIKPLPPQNILCELLTYDPETGSLHYRERTAHDFQAVGKFSAALRALLWNAQYAGAEAFTQIVPGGYHRGWIKAHNYMAHRVIWKMVTGEDPDQVDHINGNRADNRIANLRSVGRVVNGQNRGVGSNNQSGVVGVSYHRRIGAWMAQITVNGSRHHLGYFPTLALAADARKKAEREFGFHPNHGSCRAEKARAAMRLVIIESPYAGDIEANVAYARACMRDSLNRGEAPIASHLLYTQPGILRDEDPAERQWGIDAGLAWRRVAELAAFYVDRGMSFGMRAALETYMAERRPFEERRLFA